MHLALTLAFGVLFITHVQSNQCDMHISALITYLHDIAGYIKEENPTLYASLSESAQKATKIKAEKEKLKNQESNAMKRHQFCEIIKDLEQKVESDVEQLIKTKVYQQNSDAHSKIHGLIEYLEKIKKHQELPESIN